MNSGPHDCSITFLTTDQSLQFLALLFLSVKYLNLLCMTQVRWFMGNTWAIGSVS